MRRAPSVSLLLLLALGCTTPLHENAWIEVRTPHFVIWSALDEGRSVALGRELESFRQVVLLLTNVGRVEPRVPTFIYALPAPESRVGLPSKLGGFFRAGLRANHAVVRPVGRSLGDILYHEYTHFLVANRDARSYPLWFNEGFAELLSSLEAEGNTIRVGMAPEGCVQALGQDWISFREVLTQRDYDRPGVWRSLFYAQSWALVHYLTWGREGRDFARENQRYLELIKGGADEEEAFEVAFGIPVRKLKREIQSYLRRGVPYRELTLREPLEDADIRVRALAPDEIAQGLGELALEVVDLEAAREWFEAALVANPGSARATAGLANTTKLENRWDEAGALFERALELAPDDPLTLLDAAKYFHDRAEASGDAVERRGFLRSARIHYARAHSLAPDDPETLTLYGSTFLAEGEDTSKGLDALEAAHGLLPGLPHVKFQLARAYVVLDRRDEALPLLRSVVAWSHGEHTAAQELLESLTTAAAEPVGAGRAPAGH